MRVFVTGASGWIGSAVVGELLENGHDVLGLARSDGAAEALAAVGATAHRGNLDDLDSLRSGAEASDGVIHLAFKHDFSDFAGAGRTERAAVEAIADTLVDTDRPLLVAAGIAMLAPGRILAETDVSPMTGPDAPRGGSERFALDYADRGVRSVALRFAPTVHGEGDHGFVSTIVTVAREKGISGYVGDGSNRWPAVHRADAARMVRLALEKAPAGSVVHGIAEQGIATREIAELVGSHLGLPVESIAPDAAPAHFGWIGAFFGQDIPASSALTQQLLGWTPTHPTLRDDLEAGYYFR